MISLKAIQVSFTTNHSLFYERQSFKNMRQAIYLCKSNNSDNEADSRKQDLLVRMAMLQTQKVRLTDYLDERSEYLNKFASEANSEVDQIGENALRELDEAGARIMENIESKMQAFEESMELKKVEIDENEKKVADFKGQIEDYKNEGLFFENLGEKTSLDKVKAKEENQTNMEMTMKNGGSVIRRNIYLVLIAFVVIGLTDALISSTSDWRKVAYQTIYEQIMLSKTKKIDEKSNKLRAFFALYNFIIEY